MPINAILATLAAAIALFVALESYESMAVSEGKGRLIDAGLVLLNLTVAGLGFGVAAVS